MLFRGDGVADINLFTEWSNTPNQDKYYSTGPKKYTGFIPKTGYDKLGVSGTGSASGASYLEISSIKLYRERVN